uniref:SCP domain-containing protein n=1 Tax=Meloidogyne incognita TaxID=6306 RepID=A0A914NQX9_MELIC
MAIDQAGRDAVVYWHNYFRAELVAGRVKNKTGELLPKAKNMMQMYFSLELEKQAQEWADKCTYSHSNPYGNYGENFYAYARMDNDSAAIEYVVKGWWSELIYRGALGPYPGQDCVAFDAPQNNRGIGHWTQLAWWNTNLVGCGIGRCPKYKSYVVCQYLYYFEVHQMQRSLGQDKVPKLLCILTLTTILLLHTRWQQL